MTSSPVEPISVFADELPVEMPVSESLLLMLRTTSLASMLTARNRLLTLRRPASVATKAEAKSANTLLAPGEPTSLRVLASTDAKGAATKPTKTWAVATGTLLALTVSDWPSLKTEMSTLRDPLVKAD